MDQKLTGKRPTFSKKKPSLNFNRVLILVALIAVGIWFALEVNNPEGEFEPLFLPTPTATRTVDSLVQEGEAYFEAGKIYDPEGKDAIDAYYDGVFKQKLQKEKWITQLKRVYNRGFTTGFYFNQATIKDSQLNSPANVSHFRYIEMGKILTYHPTGVAKIELNNGTLKIGDKIIVMSTDGKHETYFNQIVRDIRYNGENVKNTNRATEEKPIIITISVDQPSNGKKIDAIYKFTDETYSTPRYDSKKRKKSSYKLK